MSPNLFLDLVLLRQLKTIVPTTATTNNSNYIKSKKIQTVLWEMYL